MRELYYSTLLRGLYVETETERPQNLWTPGLLPQRPPSGQPIRGAKQKLKVKEKLFRNYMKEMSQAGENEKGK